MIDLLDMAKALSRIAAIKVSPELTQELIACIDATRLIENDEQDTVLAFVAKASQLPIASICIYPEYLSVIKEKAEAMDIPLCSVANFPLAEQTQDAIVESIRDLEQRGCQEIDIVFPYQEYLDGNKARALEIIAAARLACPKDTTLKVIMESGAFENLDDLYQASLEVIKTGADFIKTSTGKYAIGASLDSAFCMLTAIKDSGKTCGFKVSGGIKTLTQACQYLALTKLVLQKETLTRDDFRVGSSQLLDELSSAQ